MADLLFDAAEHRYTTPAGAAVPSVTGILKACGHSTDFEGLRELSAWKRGKIDHRRDLGSAVHADTHADDDGDLDPATVHPEVAPFLECWREFRRRKQLAPVLRERILFHPGLWFCGTADGLFTMPGFAGLVLPDLKIGDPEDAAAQYQTAGYEVAYRFEHPTSVPIWRWSVQLTPDATEPYKITTYEDYGDLRYWSTVIIPNFYNFRRKRMYGLA
jgi:hypothetical protein